MNVLLILTNSYDVTTDLLIERIEGESVFRLNFDQIAIYAIRLDAEGFSISDSTGRVATSKTIRKAYWRKPFNGEGDHDDALQKYVDAEMRYVLAELVNLLWLEQKLVLVEPYAEKRTGKLLQLRIARNYFAVPAYEFLLNQQSTFTSAVVKSLSNEPVGDNVLYTTVARMADLDQSVPWFVEQLVPGLRDVTVVFIRGQVFAFSLERDFLDKSVDWRQFISSDQRWEPHPLSVGFQTLIERYMAALSLDFGRLDFLLDQHDEYWFCEVNPNGQYAWLDLKDEYGLLTAVIEQISPSTRAWPIANRHPLQHLQ